MGSLIEIRDVVKEYVMGTNIVKALDGVSLDIGEGEFVAVLGPSGSGKSTLMNILGCIDIPDSGTYTLDGSDVSSLSEDELSEIRNLKVGFVFQRFNLLPKYTAVHNVALPLLLRGDSKKDAYDEARLRLESVGLGERTDHKPTELSGGQQQRVSIARAMVGSPRILLADEPTGALDTKSGEEIMKIFEGLNAEGATIIVITHDVEVAQRAERVISIRDGRIVEDTRK